MKTLPDVPSELIRLAIHDLELAEKDPRYRIEMGTWHEPDGDVCEVCLAGSVMAFSRDERPEMNVDPAEYDEPDKFYAIDEFRSGRVDNGLKQMGVWPVGISHLPVMRYRDDRAAFKRDMLAMADMLEARGL